MTTARARSGPTGADDPRPRRRTISALVGAVALLVVGLATPASRAGASPGGRTVGGSVGTGAVSSSGPLRVRSVTPWVRPNGTWSVRFDSAGVPADGTISYSVRRPLTGSTAEVRTEMAREWAGGGVPAALQAPTSVPVASIIAGESLALDVPIRSVSDGSAPVFVPNPGIHPVLIELDAADGTPVQRLVLHLVRLPESPSTDPVRLSVTVPVSGGPVITPERTAQVSAEDRDRLRHAADVLEALPPEVTTVVPDAELIDGLAATGRSDDTELRTRVLAALSGRSLLRTTWAPIHLEGWARDGRATDLQAPLVADQSSLDDALRSLGGARIDSRTWGPDATMGPAALGALSTAGVDRVVVEQSRLTDRVPSASKIFTLDSGGSTVDALVVDDDVEAALRSSDLPDGEAAGRATALMASAWFGDQRAHQATVVLIDDGVPTTTVQALGRALSVASDPVVRPTSLGDAFDGVDRQSTGTKRQSRPLTRSLRSVDVPGGVGALSSYLDKLRVRVDGRDAMVKPDPDPVPLSWLLLTAEHRTLDADAQRRYLDATARLVDADFARVNAPPARSFTVTSRQASLPLQFTNQLQRPVRVRVRFVSTRLTVRGGSVQTLTLRPGVTPVRLPVTVRTSGQFRLLITVSTPDGGVNLHQSVMSIRSTAFSGVGLVLSIAAAAFLVVWWIRTLRRERRERQRGGKHRRPRRGQRSEGSGG